MAVSDFGFNHQEMIDQVSDEVRNVSIAAKITRWLNMGIIDIAHSYVFGTLHKYATKATASGNPDIILEDDLHWLKTVEIPATQRKIWPEDEQRLSESYPDYRTRTGTITRYYLNGTVMGLYQVPSGIFTVTYSYQKRLIKLDAT